MTFADALQMAQVAADEARHEAVVDLSAAAFSLADAATVAAGDRGELYFLRADSLRHLGRWAAAAAEFRKVCDLQHTPDGQPRACRAYRLLSEIARRSRHYDEALQFAEVAVAMAASLDDQVGLLFSRVPLARVLSDRGRSDEAEPLLHEVLAAATATLAEQPAEQALVLVAARTVLSLLHFRRHQPAEALSCLQAVRDLAETVPHAVTRAAYHRQLAILHEVQQGYSAAIRHLNIALDLYDRVRFEPGRYDVYWSLSQSYTDMGDLRTARICLEQCAATAQRLDLKPELGKSKSSFAELELREGDYQSAVQLFREDLAISATLQDEQALGHCNRKIADCYRLMGDLARAEEHARASMAHFLNMGREGEANQVRVLLGRILVDAGRVDEAAEMIQAARQAAGDGGRDHDRAALLRAWGQLARARGELPEAVQALEASVALLDQAHPSRELASTHFEIGLVYRELEQIDETKQHLTLAVDTAGILGSRDLWQQAVDALWQVDVTEAQRLMLKPYLPGRAVDELRQGEAEGRLETATVMFVDMRGATALSGTLTPLDLSEVVSAFLGPVVRIIMRWSGSVDKFIGDCVMAVFGLQDSVDGADSATRAGLEIIEYMEATKQIRQRTGASVLEATIGVNTGEVVAGCFGPLLRRDYTVLGYHVNLAQRLQSLAGSLDYQYGTRMVISETTRQNLLSTVPLSAIDLRSSSLKGIDTELVGAWLVRADEAIAAAG
ncbi:MAG: tetratricopeptide repeat protein [Fimbriimonadaceae bacterium]|nr:tetratricopeptide repeat protein [Fimbriimonadaceae bacterium]